jgi:hypothetical protein
MRCIEGDCKKMGDEETGLCKFHKTQQKRTKSKKQSCDRLTTSVQLTFNWPLTEHQMDVVMENFKEAFENRIMESTVLTDLIGHVHFEWSQGKKHKEICV